MTHAAYGHFPAQPPARAGVRAGHIVNILGALTSVSLLVGATWWAYRLAVLDVSGVPVLLAAQGPMRIVPADPGGRLAPHAGLAVNAVVGDEAPVLAERVVLAPPPATLDPADGLDTVAAAPPPPADPDAAMAAAVDRALAGIAADEGSGAGLASSPRPRARPGSPATAIGDLALTDVQAVAAVRVGEVDPATLRAGTRLAQLGAFDTEALARAAWDRIARRAGALMEGKDRVLQPATSAGRAFIRLRVAGFDSEDEARRFCTALEAGEPGALRCIPVTHR